MRLRFVFLLPLLMNISQAKAEHGYPVADDFKAVCRITAPLGRGVLAMGNTLLGAVPKGMRSDNELSVELHDFVAHEGERVDFWVVKPNGSKGVKPVILFIHGGGFVFKAAPYHYRLAKQYAQRTDSVVVMVDYRTAHNNSYGTPLRDCCQAWQWIVSSADSLGVDISQSTVVGDSAGGFLAVKTALWAEEIAICPPAKLMLVYPVIDCSMRTPSMERFVDTPVWNAELNAKMWEYYLQGNSEESLLDISPSTTFPITYIESAEFDPLRDEADIFASILQRAGVPTTHIQTKSTMHGFDMVQRSPITQRQIELRCDFLKW